MDGYIDPSEIIGAFKRDWRLLWDKALTPYQNTCNLIDRFVVFPDHEKQRTIAAVYLWTNPKFAECLPILFCGGKQGSAKSDFLTLAKHFRDSKIFGPNTRFVGVRNHLTATKFLDPGSGLNLEADGAILLLDNFWAESFSRDDNWKALIINSYKKSTDLIEISGEVSGTNKTFRTFASIIVSSVEPVYSHHDLRELKRRTLPLFFSPWEEIGDEDKLAIREAGKLTFKEVNWKDFDSVYHDFWGTRSHCLQWGTHAYQTPKPKGIPSAAWEWVNEMHAVSMVIGAFESPLESLDFWEEHYHWHQDKMNGIETPLEQFLGDLFAGFQGKPIPNATLVSFIQTQVKANQLLSDPKPKEIRDAMSKKGYAQVRGNWVIK